MEKPTVKEYMTVNPRTIEAGATLRQAMELMSQFRIRHLPVLKDGTLFGVISDRDLRMFLLTEGLDAAKLEVGAICQRPPFAVKSDTPLSEVASALFQKHMGSALVLEGEKLVGIFTTMDACRALATLAARYPQ